MIETAVDTVYLDVYNDSTWEETWTVDNLRAIFDAEP